MEIKGEKNSLTNLSDSHAGEEERRWRSCAAIDRIIVTCDMYDYDYSQSSTKSDFIEMNELNRVFYENKNKTVRKGKLWKLCWVVEIFWGENTLVLH